MDLSETAELTKLGLSLRLEAPGDGEFLERLYASTREAELRLTGWTPEQQTAFCIQQFRAQKAHYDIAYAGASRQIVLVDGSAAGRLYLFRSGAGLRIVDISLLPLYRNRGFGTALMRSVLSAADAEGLSVSLHVATFNPARAWYERLGFRQVDDDGAYISMHRASRAPIN